MQCRFALEMDLQSGSTYLLEADRATESTYLVAYVSCLHLHSESQSRPVIQRQINPLTLLAASFSNQHQS